MRTSHVLVSIACLECDVFSVFHPQSMKWEHATTAWAVEDSVASMAGVVLSLSDENLARSQLLHIPVTPGTT